MIFPNFLDLIGLILGKNRRLFKVWWGDFGHQIIYHPQSGWFEDTPLKGGTEAGCPLKGVEERTSLVGLRSVRGTATALL